MKKIIFIFVLIYAIGVAQNGHNKNFDKHPVLSNQNLALQAKQDHQIRKVKKAVIVPKLDGEMDDPIWKETMWYGLDQKWLGPSYEFNDFFGRYKMAWTPEALYLLVEIKDDILFDQHKNPLKLWWDDDCVEIFIDADNSGGDHQYSNNAFAYHVALDGNVVDLDQNQKPILYNNHVATKRKTNNDVSIWEFEIIIYDDSYKEGKINDPLILGKGQKLGFALAYNDNDGSPERENFIGSVFIPGDEKNLGWINADVFGTILLIE